MQPTVSISNNLSLLFKICTVWVLTWVMVTAQCPVGTSVGNRKLYGGYCYVEHFTHKVCRGSHRHLFHVQRPKRLVLYAANAPTAEAVNVCSRLVDLIQNVARVCNQNMR